MTASARKQLRADWRALAKTIGPGRLPSAQETDKRYLAVMACVADGRDPYPPRET